MYIISFVENAPHPKLQLFKVNVQLGKCVSQILQKWNLVCLIFCGRSSQIRVENFIGVLWLISLGVLSHVANTVTGNRS